MADKKELDPEEIVKLERPVRNPETGENTGWKEFEAPRFVAEKEMNKERRSSAWAGVRYKEEKKAAKKAASESDKQE